MTRSTKLLTEATLGEADILALDLAEADAISLVPLELTVKREPVMYTAKSESKATARKDSAYLSMPISPPSDGIGPARSIVQTQPVLPPTASTVGGRYTDAASRALMTDSVSNRSRKSREGTYS